MSLGATHSTVIVSVTTRHTKSHTPLQPTTRHIRGAFESRSVNRQDSHQFLHLAGTKGIETKFCNNDLADLCTYIFGGHSLILSTCRA